MVWEPAADETGNYLSYRESSACAYLIQQLLIHLSCTAQTKEQYPMTRHGIVSCSLLLSLIWALPASQVSTGDEGFRAGFTRPVPGATSAAKPKVDVSKIYGKIKFVKSFPDYKVQVVNSFPDLKVQKVSSFPDKPGKWKIVDSFPDYKIQIVDSFPDFKIKYVNSFPGVP